MFKGTAKKGKGTPTKPEKKDPWDFIFEELTLLQENTPCADDDYDGPSWEDQSKRLKEVIFALNAAGAPAPTGIFPYDGHYVQIEWILPGDIHVYAEIENLTDIQVMYTYPDRAPLDKTVTDPLKILPN